MKTNVIMQRELLGGKIGQRTDNKFFNSNDLFMVGNKWRCEQGLPLINPKFYFAKKETKEFLKELKKEFGVIKTGGRGRGNKLWVHPILFIDMALYINPKLKLEVYKWI